jgi:hypothetical protein
MKTMSFFIEKWKNIFYSENFSFTQFGEKSSKISSCFYQKSFSQQDWLEVFYQKSVFKYESRRKISYQMIDYNFLIFPLNIKNAKIEISYLFVAHTFRIVKIYFTQKENDSFSFKLILL